MTDIANNPHLNGECGITEAHSDSDHVETIDVTPTWQGILPGLIAIVRNGETVEAQKTAEAELRKMARLADAHVAYLTTDSNAQLTHPGPDRTHAGYCSQCRARPW